jgi:sn-glycerol 3-phosphate transport system permease protein
MTSLRVTRSRRWLPVIYLAPSMILLGLFVFYPTVDAAWTSLTNWNGISSYSSFVGLQNYVNLYHDSVARQALWNTCWYTALTLPVSIALAFGVALLALRSGWVSRVLRLAFTVPFVVSIPVVSVVWVWILDPNFGILNYGFNLVGLGKQQWLDQTSMAMVGIAIPSVWRQAGFFMLILLAGLKGIDPSYLEAAMLDGAGFWTRTFRLVLPLLSPQLFFCLIFGVIDSFQVFAQVDMMTQGGPLNSTNVLVYDLYQEGFSYFHVGYACAMAVVLMLGLGAVTFIQQRWIGSRVFYQ